MSGLAVKSGPLFHFSGINNSGVYSFEWSQQTSSASLTIKINKMQEKIFRFQLEPGQQAERELIPGLFSGFALLDPQSFAHLLIQLEKIDLGNFKTGIQTMIEQTQECGRSSNDGSIKGHFVLASMESQSTKLISKQAQERRDAETYIRERHSLGELEFKAWKWVFDYYDGKSFAGGLFSPITDENRTAAIIAALWFPEHSHHQRVVQVLQGIVVDRETRDIMKKKHGDLVDPICDEYNHLIRRRPLLLRVIVDNLNWPGHIHFSLKLTDEQILASVEQNHDLELQTLQSQFKEQMHQLEGKEP